MPAVIRRQGTINRALVLDPAARIRQLSEHGSSVNIDKAIPIKRYFRSGSEMERQVGVGMNKSLCVWARTCFERASHLSPSIQCLCLLIAFIPRCLFIVWARHTHTHTQSMREKNDTKRCAYA